MPAGETVNLVSRDGSTIPVPVDQVADALASGFTVETDQQAAARLGAAAKEDTYGGAAGTALATLAGGARGLTFGASDVLGEALGGGETLRGLREVNPLASTVGEIGGAVVGSFAAPGSLLARTPAGLASRLGQRVAGLGEGAGIVGRTAATAAGGALEGGLQNAGAYISDVALGDRELSADGFMGAMGKGALWGGVAGGALSVAGDGLTAARRLFPRQEITREAVQAAELAAKDEIASAVTDSETLAQSARDRLRQIRADAAAQDLATKVRLDEIAVRKAEEVAAANVRAAEAKAATAEERLARAKAPAKRTRKAIADDTAPEATTATQPEAVASAATEDTTTALERQLMATKQGLDSGSTLTELGAKPKASHIEDALNAEIAKVSPEAKALVDGLAKLEDSKTTLDGWLERYKGGSVSKFERQQATRDWADRVRPKEAGYYTKLAPDSQTPGMSEGSLGLPRGRQSVWRGSEEARAAADARTMAKLSPEEQAAADAAVEEAASRRSKRIANEVTSPEVAADAPVDAKVEDALRSKVDSIDDDIHESAKAISQHEAAAADIAEALGPAAPPTSQARAAAFREAQQKAERGAHEATVRATDDAQKAADTIALRQEVDAAAPRGKAATALGAAQDAGAALEALRMMGIDVPDPKNIPVIGPILSAYLKARVLGKTFGRFGGRIAETAETTIASKAAQTKQRMYQALDKMTEAAEGAVRKVAPRAGGPAAILGHVLFDDGEPKAKPYSSQVAPKGSIAETYLARADEVARAMQPGAIAKAVRARVRTSDPTVVDAIADAQERKLKFLDSKMPKPMEAPVPTQAHMPWVPSRAEINQWARYVQAAEDPIAVIEAAATDGHVSVEAVETLKTVYPKLFSEAQQRILQRALDTTKPIPYARRVQMSVMFDMPMDGSQTPEGAAFLQQGYKPPPPPPQPAPIPTTPTVTADVQMAERTDPNTRS